MKNAWLSGCLLATLVVASPVLSVWPLRAAAPPRPAAPLLLTVFAASSMTQALETLAPTFAAQTGVRVRYSFAATSTLARQIEAGAGADVFVSADDTWMTYLVSRGRIVTATRMDFLSNRLVLIVPADRATTIELKQGFNLRDLIGRGRIAVGDPAHVPAGRYAREALTSLGVWTEAAGRLAPAESVRAALALVERGEVPAGIVYESDAALSTNVKVAGVFPAASHTKIVYTAAAVSGRNTPATRQFLAFLRSAAARDVFLKHHFSVL